MKKIEVKVSIYCHKCKSEVLKAVTKLQGIDQVTVDADKGMLTVVGEVDPVRVVSKVRKTGKYAEIMSVGPPKEPDPPKTKSPKIDPPQPLPPCCTCPQPLIVFDSYDGRICTIL